jgi:hypothetical protein
MMSGWMVRGSMMKSGSCSSKYTKGHYGSKENWRTPPAWRNCCLGMRPASAVRTKTQREQRISPSLPWLVPSPGTSPNRTTAVVAK